MEPLERVLRAVGDIGTADEPFEQPDPRCELAGFDVLARLFDGNPHARDAGVGRGSVTPAGRLSLGDRDERGGRVRQTGAEPGGQRFQQ